MCFTVIIGPMRSYLATAPVAVWNALLEEAGAPPGFLEGQCLQFRKPPSKLICGMRLGGAIMPHEIME